MRHVLVCAALCLGTCGAASALDISSELPQREAPQKKFSIDRGSTVGKTEASPADHRVLAAPVSVPTPIEYSRQELCDVVAMVAQAHNLPIGFFVRLIWQESGFRTHVVSSAGAQGIAQFMPGTAAEMGLEDPFDPTEALPASAQFLRDLHRQFGNHGLAAAAYNAGPRRISNWLAKRSTLPKETRAYVVNITGQQPERWVGVKKTVANFAIPLGTRCQQIAAPIVAAQAARWSRPETRARVMRARLEVPAEPVQQTPEAAPVQQATAVPVQQAPAAAPMRHAPVVAPVAQAPAAAPKRQAPMVAPVQQVPDVFRPDVY